jgi:hypothetical protein
MSSTVTNDIPLRYRAYFPHNNPMLLDGLNAPNQKFDNLVVNNLTVNTGATGPWRIPIYALNGTGFFMNNGGVDGDYNTFVGFNTGIGANVGTGATEGSTFIGYRAGFNCVTGTFNTCLGFQTTLATGTSNAVNLGLNTTITGDGAVCAGRSIASDGENAVTIGRFITADSDDSIILGGNIADQDAPESVIVGQYITMQTGTANVCVGRSSGMLLATGCNAFGQFLSVFGFNNTAIGTSISATGAENNIFGKFITCNGTGSLALGTSMSIDADSSVGIGKFITVTGTNCAGLGTSMTLSATGCIGVGVNLNATNDWEALIGRNIGSDAVETVSIGYDITNSSTGGILIGSNLVSSDTYAIALGHNINATGGFYVNPVRGDVATANVYYDPVNFEFVYDNSPSTATLKENIVNVNLSSGVVIDAMQPVTYNLISDETKRQHVGFIAESLLPIEEKFVRKNTSGEVVTIDYDAIVTYLVAEVKSLRARVAALETPTNF